MPFIDTFETRKGLETEKRAVNAPNVTSRRSCVGWSTPFYNDRHIAFLICTSNAQVLTKLVNVDKQRVCHILVYRSDLLLSLFTGVL